MKLTAVLLVLDPPALFDLYAHALDDAGGSGTDRGEHLLTRGRSHGEDRIAGFGVVVPGAYYGKDARHHEMGKWGGWEGLLHG